MNYRPPIAIMCDWCYAPEEEIKWTYRANPGTYLGTITNSQGKGLALYSTGFYAACEDCSENISNILPMDTLVKRMWGRISRRPMVQGIGCSDMLQIFKDFNDFKIRNMRASLLSIIPDIYQGNEDGLKGGALVFGD